MPQQKMTTEHLVFLSVPGLRVADLDRQRTPSLFAIANRGTITELTPTFPCVTSCVQAGIWTGRPPGGHGVIANGFYHRDRREVEFWVGRNGVVQGAQIWGALRERRPGLTSAVWHAQNIKDAAADFIITPEPIHEPDGTTKLWCYSKPEGLYQKLLDEGLGHFPLQHYWGPLANIESTRWILKAASWLNERHRPNFHWIYIPHLDYASQKFGPNSPQARNALVEFDAELAAFVAAIQASEVGESVQFVVAGEYAMTDVSGVVYPNRVLRDAELLVIQKKDEAEFLDFRRSPAFAMVDHQFAHVFVDAAIPAAERRHTINAVVDLFKGANGVAGVFAGGDRRKIGLEHDRAGDVVLISDDAHWFAYYWWHDDAAAPSFARSVDIHRKPGYDPVELFFDPVTKSIPLNADLVKGSHGVPATGPQHRTALITSWPTELPTGVRDTDLFGVCLDAMTRTG